MQLPSKLFEKSTEIFEVSTSSSIGNRSIELQFYISMYTVYLVSIKISSFVDKSCKKRQQNGLSVDVLQLFSLVLPPPMFVQNYM
jgi:hypothetical protein